MLSAIVSKVTGQKVIDYLQPKLFEPLGIAKPDWEEDPKHINTGGMGTSIENGRHCKVCTALPAKRKMERKVGT